MHVSKETDLEIVKQPIHGRF